MAWISHRAPMQNDRLKAEADALMAKAGLAALLAGYAGWFIGGSYGYDLMCWRDLDVYALDPERNLPRSFEVAFHVTQRLGAARARFTNHTGGAPDGFYWGIVLGDTRRDAWKLDLWFLPPVDFERHRAYGEAMRARLTDANRATILALKEMYWRRPEYRDTITSHQIYEAVLTHGVKTSAEFERHRVGAGRLS